MAVRPGYKQMEVGVIPEDWYIKPCSALSDLITVGIVIRPAQYYVRHGVPALRSANIRENKIDEAEMVFISEKANTLLLKSQLRTGDVLTVRTGYPGTSAVVPQTFAGANCIDILITRPSKGISSQYLSAWINSPFGKYQVLRNQGGLAQQHFNVADLRNLVVALPPTLAEQQAIAEALRDVDGLISAVDALIAKKRALKQGAMQELLTGQRRLPGFAGDWEVKTLGEIAGVSSGGTPDRTNAAYWNGSIPWITTSQIDFNRIAQAEEFITKLGLANSSAKKFSKNTILMAMYGQGKTRGKVAILDIDATINQACAAITPHKSVSVEYIFFNLSQRYDEIRSLSNTGNQENLNGNIIKSIPVLLPSLAEQTAIAHILADMDAEIAALAQKRAKTVALKQGMMQELLTGAVRLGR